MAASTATVVSASDVARAQAELERMKRSLRGWLKYRLLNDAVVAGTAPTKKPRGYAIAVISNRNMTTEAKLAQQLYVLLTESFPDADIPLPDVTVNPNAAVVLAQMAISPTPPPAASAPIAAGMAAWLWPVLIVGGLLLAVTTAIQSQAEVAQTAEQTACIEAGACTDSGFWLKAGGIAMLVYVAWQMGVGDQVKRALAPRKGRA